MSFGKIVLAGNPNVGKSTLFNLLTGMKQHTGNWSGKTVGIAEGILRHNGKTLSIIDLPGTYSLSADSAEEEISRNFLCFEKFDAAVVVCDACCLERNLIFALRVAQLVPGTIICVNMLDDAAKKGIHIDLNALSEETGLPVAGISASTGEGTNRLKDMIFELAERKSGFSFVPVRYPGAVTSSAEKIMSVLENKGIKTIQHALMILENDRGYIGEFEKRYGKISENEKLSTALSESEKILSKSGFSSGISEKISACNVLRAEEICLSAVSFSGKKNLRDRKADSVLTGKLFGIPVMLILFGLIFWITVSGANYPSALLSALFDKIGFHLENLLLSVGCPPVLRSMLTDGIWNVAGWVVAVMLPPMAIFFPLFTFLEDIGYLPRVAFNLDRGFCRAGTCGKQALTMWSVYKSSFSHIF